MIEFKNVSVLSDDAQTMLSELSDTLTALIGHDGAMHVNYADFGEIGAVFVVGYRESVPCCCAGIRRVNDETGEVKRVYARKNAEGNGMKLMEYLEKWASENGYAKLILECRPNNTHALRFYEKCGYTVCENFPPYDVDTYAVCMEKCIGK